MVNMYKMKRRGAFLFCGLFTVIFFYIGVQFYGLAIGLGTMFAGLLASMLVGGMLVKTPFRDMLEGKGLLVMNMDSTGIVRFSICGLASPYVKGKMGNKKIMDVWDRSTVVQIEPGKNNKQSVTKNKEGGITINIDEKDYNDSRFALMHYPCLIYNDQIESLITKDFLAEKEKGTFAEHGVLFLNRRIEELTSNIRDFARYVVESTRPKKNLLQSKWFWIVMIFFMVLMGLLFAPSILNAVQGMWGNVQGASSSVGGNIITPR